MLLEQLQFMPKGKISIINAITSEILLEHNNAIQPFANESMAKLLAGDLSYIPSVIGVYLASVNIALSVNPLIISNPTTTSVKYAAYFDLASFSGDLDEVRLECGLAGTFSIVTGLTFTKTTPIYITWTITIS